MKRAMSSLAEKLSDMVGAAFAAQNLPAELGAVRVSDRPDLAQFQCNGAMAAAKSAQKNPREVAQTIADDLAQHTELEKIDIAGPGFININVTNEYLAAHLAEIQQSPRLGVEKIAGAQTVILDYGGPNIAKPMHVGHLRASIIGDALRRMYDFAGYNAIGDVHMGDWGLPMGQVMSELKARHPEWIYFDPKYEGPYPEESPVSMDDLEEIYPAASRACKEDEDRMEKARAATAKLQHHKPGYKALWQHFIDVSIAGMKKNFDALGVYFDLWKGEADVHDLIAPIVKKLKAKGLVEESQGALIMKLEQDGDKKDIPPLILYKSDGAVMYGTTDLATIVDRMQEYKPAQMIYVVDQRQSLHFEQVFRAARKAGIAGEDEVVLTHAGFGTMNGPDGKPFKTREGGVMRLEDLIAMGIEKAQARLDEADLAQDMDEAERADVAHKVAIAAIKFADLQNNRTADYVFDLDRLTAFEGKTGPYLLYQAVRIKSLLRKAESQNLGILDSQNFMIEDADKPLALPLTELPDHFDTALENNTPHVLCDYVFKLAQSFSSFYGNCHILSEENEELRASRLALCELTFRQIALILGLLGIEIPERM